MTGVWQADQLSEIIVQDDGIAARKPFTVMQVFQRTVEQRGAANALTFQRDGAWQSYSWQTYYELCRKFAKSLVRIGVKPHDCVNVIGHNAPEWFISNLGTIAAGAIIAGIYTTNGADACRYISEHCQAKLVVVQNRQHLDKYLQIARDLPALRAVVMWEGEMPTDIKCAVPVYSFHQFLELGKDVDNTTLDARIDAQLPGHCCTLIYTSGTTGPPKAVMISHDNFTWTSACILQRLDCVDANERGVSFLPLSHVAAQLLDIHLPMTVGCEIFFIGADAMKGKLTHYLREIRPTFFFGVPRVWEKVMEAMREMGVETTGLRKAVADWARAKGAQKTELAQYGADGYLPFGFRLANRIVLKRIQDALGLDQCKLCLTGAAPISAEVISFFGSIDVPLYEIFGQSECTGPHSINIPGKWKIGSIGMPLPGTKTKINQVTGEICYSGRHIFMGYMNDEAETKKTLQDGWLSSGDVGQFDEDGFLSITGRIKELIITAGGENVPPVLIEDALKSELLALSNVMLIGDKRKFLTFLCTLRANASGELDPVALRIANEIGSTATTVDQAIACAKFQAYIRDGMKRVNAAATSRAQCVQKFTILPRDFSIAGGELTPTLKLKRNVVAKMYMPEIEAMYEPRPESS